MSKTEDSIESLLKMRVLRIKAITAAGIISGTVSDIINKKSKSSFFDYVTTSFQEIPDNSVFYVIENATLTTFSNQSFDYSRLELDSSKIIAFCPPDVEVD